jgi:glycosyltransferase involved in cell wall biosynthesis
MEAKPLISVLIVSYNSADFIINTLYCLEKTTKNPYKVYVRDNNSKIEDYEKLKKHVKNIKNVVLEREETELRGSMAHGTALNALAEYVDTPYFSILDADATWLKKNWDEILLKQLVGNVKVIGTQAPPQKPQDFPLMFSILFETKAFKELNVDFRPKDIEKRQDTGFEMRGKYMEAGYEGLNIEVKNTRTYQEGPFKNLLGVTEYYYNEDYTTMYASHFGRGSSLGAAKFRIGTNILYRLPVIRHYFLKRRGLKEKQEWIDICHKIVDSQ